MSVVSDPDYCTKQEIKIQLGEKSACAKSEIEYLGQIVSGRGTRLSEKKVETIKKYLTPSNRDWLHWFLSMVQCYSKYISNISNETHPKEIGLDVAWQYVTAFDKLSEAPTLRQFNPKEQVTLSVDASQYGLGAMLIHEASCFWLCFINRDAATVQPNQKRVVGLGCGLRPWKLQLLHTWSIFDVI